MRPPNSVRFQELLDGEEVALGLGHLAAFDLQEAVVHPVIGHDAGAMRAARLGDLVFMMREDQVEPAAVNVEHLAEVMLAHHRALDMPARTAAAPGAVPARLFVGGQFPEHEVARVFLVFLDRDAGAGQLLVELALRQAAIVRHGGGVEQHLAARLVGVPLVDQCGDHLDHALDVLGRARLEGRLQHGKGLDVLVVLIRGLSCHQCDGIVQRHVGMVPQRPCVDLVVDVGDVAHIGDMLRAIEMAQQPEQHVEDDRRPGIADMGIVVDRRSADIEAHVAVIDRAEVLLRTGQCVGELQALERAGFLSLSGAHVKRSPGRLAGRSVSKEILPRGNGHSQRCR